MHHNQQHVVLLARISLTLSYHSSRPSITSGRSSRLHPVSVQSCCRWVLIGRSTLARPCKGVHRRTLLMSSSLLLQLCPACLVRLNWMVLEMGGWWPYSCCFVGCCFQDSFNIARGIWLPWLSLTYYIINILSLYIMTNRSKDLLYTWDILFSLKQIQTAMKYFLINTISGHINSLTYLFKQRNCNFCIFSSNFSLELKKWD